MQYNIGRKFNIGQNVHSVLDLNHYKEKLTIKGFENDPNLVQIPVYIVEDIIGKCTLIPEIFLEKIGE